MSYRTEGLCKARRNIVFSESFPLAVGMSYKYCISIRCKCSECENNTFAEKVQCSESAVKGSIFMNAEA